jgi:polyisoprenoid-binding protein YceI
MKKSVLIFLLGSTVGFGSMAGVYYKVLRKDPAWLAEQKAAFERDQELDRIADSQACDCSKCGTVDEASKVDEGSSDGPSIEANAPIDEKIFVFKPGGLTKISFYSEAPIEDMVGINQDVKGKLTVDMNDPNRRAEGGVQVKMAGFNTGLPLRDEHFRDEKWLDTNAYPDAVFGITAVETKHRIVFGQVSEGTITGTMRLKNHTYNLKVPVKVRYIEATEELQKIYVKSNLLVVEGAFDLDLGPLNLSGMENAGGKKIARVLKVRIKLAGAEQAVPAPTADPIP